ncbi:MULTISPECIES: thiamine pyrophosphate-dependent enzyme [Dermacoccus]|uniref:thiamine pyrophosphate-dependent enzyme n=1 Tax=Dermacoccus TaxID=57495 RepID=UPI001E347DC5|nr:MULTISPECIES: thiamine pyrophosphate-dependent enzyme [Dermacoccus]MCT1604986.1 thiamine pyrophosphate-dependent enzyme [Dermacoccus nishinomiyaensis]
MANAMPMALGAQALDRRRPVVALCGDGGLMMLVGDLRTAVTYGLPATFVVFNNSKLGMVKLEQEQVGLPEYGTALDNPNFADVAAAMGLRSRRVEDPAELKSVLREAVSSPEPWLVEVVTNPDEVSVPGKVKPAHAFGFAKAKVTEFFTDRGPTGGGEH